MGEEKRIFKYAEGIWPSGRLCKKRLEWWSKISGYRKWDSGVKYFFSNQDAYEEFSSLLNNLSIDLVKECIVMQRKEIYDKHPETWVYCRGTLTIPKAEVYDPALDGGKWDISW